jgi:hypothetical protein
MLMPFGKYRGEELTDIPESYLQWILDNIENLNSDLEYEIRVILEGEPEPRPRSRPPQSKAPPPDNSAAIAKRVHEELVKKMVPVIDRWRRQMARILHPDLGGDDELMKLCNNAADELLKNLKSQ